MSTTIPSNRAVRRHGAPFAAAMALALATTCLLDSPTADASEWVQIGATREAAITVPADTHLYLDLPVGEVQIIGTDGDELRAQMDIECKSSSKRCAKRAEQATFTTELRGNDITLAVTPGSMKSYKGGNVRITVEVPRSESLSIEFGAGELRVEDVDACVNVRMFAGEADLRLADTRIDTISLKTGMGESTLYVDDDSVEGRRPFLVGSKVNHSLGNGECSLAARLRFGELTARLH